MNKKAVSIIMVLGGLLAVLGLLFLSFQAVIGYAEDETVMKINLAEDLTMMVNTMVGIPGDITVAYPHDVEVFSFILRSNSIIVLIKGETDVKNVVRLFNLPQGYVAEGTVEEISKICLEKSHHKIILRACEENES